MAPTTLQKLAMICLVSATVSTTMALSAAVRASQAVDLFGRADLSERAGLTCADPTYTACNKNGLPGNFCCGPTFDCVAFNSGSSAICCAKGKDCSTISTIDCDISKQNATASPGSQLFTTNLQATLETCAGKCCPQGYSCDGNSCKLDSSSTSSSSAAPSSTSTAPPTSSTQSGSASPSNTASTTASAAKATNSQIPPEAHSNPFPPAAVVVGLFCGLILGIILTVIAMCCFGRRRKDNPPDSPNISSVAASISDPIYRPQDGDRSDFLRHESKSKYANRTSKVRSLFSRTPTMRSIRSIRSRDAPVDGIGRSIPPVPKTPVNQRSPMSSPRTREPSMESIKIYSPPNGGLGRPNTTFTDMMADAGLKQGEPYLGSPGRGEQRWRDV